jgi:hypothetical protein
MATRKWGLTIDPDGTMRTSICRAKRPGTGRCHHFAHVKDAETAQKYIALHQLQPDLMKIVDYDKDMKSLSSAVRDYLEDRGVQVEHTPADENVSILDTWFHGDRKLADKILGDAQEANVIPSIKANRSVTSSVKDLVKDGVKVKVDGNRFAGMSMEYDSELDTDVWMTANGLNADKLDGDAPVTIMVANGSDENAAVGHVRSSWAHHEDNDDLLSEERREDFKNAGYASLHGHKV